MILVDSSVWIDYFTGKPSAEANKLDQVLGNTPLALGDLILTEVLQGFRFDRDYRKAKNLLEEFRIYHMLGRDQAIRSAENFRKLRKKGITVRKTADVVIASFCLSEGLPLLFSDRDFQPFVEHLGLIDASA